MFSALSGSDFVLLLIIASVSVRIAVFVFQWIARVFTPHKPRPVPVAVSSVPRGFESNAQIRMLNAHAHGGDSKAQVELALRYLHGDGVTQDSDKADEWFQKAAQKGNPKGLLYLGYLCENAGDYESAETHLLRAAERENGEAMERLGRLYMEGGDAFRDPVRGLHYYKLGAMAGRKSAQRLYAECLLMGKGIAQDIAAGTIEMQLAAKLGDKTAQAILDMGVERFIGGGGNKFMMEDTGPEFTDNQSRKPIEDQVINQNPFFTIGNEPAPGETEFLEMSAEEAIESKPLLVPEDRTMTLQQATAQLERLIGLDEAKNALLGMTNRMRLHRLRQEHNLPVAPVNAHMVFSGNPGTGKTTAARLVGNIFREIGVLQKGHVVEVARADLIGQYVGQTAPLVQKKVAEALDGVLFIDEAYTLMDGRNDKGGFGSEAVATLLKLMEDNRHRLVVIMAGYKDEMKALIRSNPGLASRFSKVIDFEDFNGYELFQVFEEFVKEFGYTFDTDAAEELAVVLPLEMAKDDPHFGNARFVRRLFDETLNCLANRIATIKDPDKSDLVHITKDDIRQAYKNINS